MSFICTVKYEEVGFDVYGDIEPPDHSVGYNGSVSIYCICFEHDKFRTDLTSILDEQFKEYVQGEAELAMDELIDDEADERAEREWEDREDR